MKANSVLSDKDPFRDKVPFYDSYNPSFEPNSEHIRLIKDLSTEKTYKRDECGKSFQQKVMSY